MSHISSSRMPHAYAKPENDDGVGETVKADLKTARDAVGGISGKMWMLGALGVGAVGAALYASVRPGAPAPRKRRTANRKSAVRRPKAQAA